MRVLWLDDNADDPRHRAALVSEWNLEDSEVLAATDLRRAQQILESTPDVRLAILDLLWPGEPESPSTKATGIQYLVELRKKYPGLLIVTRSHIKKPAVLTAYINAFMKHRVFDHFLIGDDSKHAGFRRDLVIERAEAADRDVGLSAFLGERWGVVMFADISGFTTMTEKLWGENKPKLLGTLREFYSIAIEVIAKNGGIVDKLIGDEVMAIFPATPDQRNVAAAKCVDAAVEIRNRFLIVERNFKKDLIDLGDDVGGVKWQLKIGVEAGSLLIDRVILPQGESEYCAIGFAVNVAARIKGLSGPYTITLGPTVRKLLPQDAIYGTQAFSEQTTLPGFGRPLLLYVLHEPTAAT